MPDVHLVLLIHGLWGKPAHLDAVRDELAAAWAECASASGAGAGSAKAHPAAPTTRSASTGATGMHTPPTTPPDVDPTSDSDAAHMPGWLRRRSPSAPAAGTGSASASTAGAPELVTVVANGMSFKLTYDGVDVCASRVAWELDQHVARLEDEGRHVTRISILGYSLGGLVARYLVGLLHARTPSFFDSHVPVSFTTIATPHVGIPRYNTVLSTALAFLGGRLMSRTGEQLYVVDKYCERDPRPLLEIMADPAQVFHQGMSRFKQIHIYANTVNDATVPFPSAAIEATDPFVQWDERGLQVEADEHGLVADWHFPVHAQDQAQATEAKGKSRSGYHLGTLPPVLRFRWPFNYVILALFPILFPILFLLIIGRFALDTRHSRKRLQRLARVDARTTGSPAVSPGSPRSPASPSSTGASSIPSQHGLSIDALREAIRAVERNIEHDLIDAAEYDLETHGGHSRQQPGVAGGAMHGDGCDEELRHSLLRHRPAGGIKVTSAPSGVGNTSPNGDATKVAPPSRALFLPEPTINVRMTDTQLRMVVWLNALEPAKHLAWFPNVANSHAVIVVRDGERFPVHELGRGVLRHWAGTVAMAAMAS